MLRVKIKTLLSWRKIPPFLARDVNVHWGQDKSLVLAKLSLTDISSKSKVILSVHIHRDASTHVTLQDKTSSNSSDMMLKMGS